MNIAIIPARGGSKRITHKNIKEFHGKPIIGYSIEAAIASDCFDKVFVSTDDDEIATVALGFGAEVPFVRPAELSGDFSSTVEVIYHAVNWLTDEGFEIDNVCCIYPTAPLLLAKYIKEGQKCLENELVQYAFSTTSFSFPIQRAIKLSENNTVTMFQPEHQNTRSQDLPETFHDAGQFYWGKATVFLATNHSLLSTPLPF